MSLLFYDAQTKYNSLAQLTQVWDSQNATSIAFSTTNTPYDTGRSVRLGGQNTEGNAWVVALGSTETKLRFGFWHYATGGESWFGFRNGSNRMCQFRIQSDYQVQFSRGFYNNDQAVLKSLGYMDRTTWVWYEGYIGFGNSTGFGYFRKNGRSIGSVTGVDTIASASTAALAGADTFLVAHHYTNIWVSDFMVWTDSGDWPNGWIGPQRLSVLPPNGDGTHSAWSLSAGSSGWSLIDSVALSTSDYISSTSTGNKSSFDVGAMPASAGGVINAVSAEMWGANIGGGSTELSAGIIDSSTEEYGTADVVGTGRRVTLFLPTRPGSTVAWSSTDIGALEIAVRHG